MIKIFRHTWPVLNLRIMLKASNSPPMSQHFTAEEKKSDPKKGVHPLHLLIISDA